MAALGAAAADRRRFVDTSAWFAYADRDDPDHATVRRLIRRSSGHPVTSNVVFDETVTLCASPLGHAAARKVGDLLGGGVAATLVRISAADEEAAWALFESRPDKTYSFTDCTSFVLMRRLGLRAAIALDEHFEEEGFRLDR
ncbi:MAG TPA: PIN domain-containing protein [Vicinamibacterales bacterium]|nr:PIN domain-containing protein [Vicinamibacterales bacterium]